MCKRVFFCGLCRQPWDIRSVAAAAQTDSEVHESDIGHGDSEEDFVFTYSHRDLDSPLKLHVFVTGKFPVAH